MTGRKLCVIGTFCWNALLFAIPFFFVSLLLLYFVGQESRNRRLCYRFRLGSLKNFGKGRLGLMMCAVVCSSYLSLSYFFAVCSSRIQEPSLMLSTLFCRIQMRRGKGIILDWQILLKCSVLCNQSQDLDTGSSLTAVAPSDAFTGPRVAVCLVGAARAFELTGKTLAKYLLEANNHTDVFLHAPFDKDSHKFTLLKGAARFVKARIFFPQRLPEIQIQREVLTGANSPNGIQVRCHKLTWKSLVCFAVQKNTY